MADSWSLKGSKMYLNVRWIIIFTGFQEPNVAHLCKACSFSARSCQQNPSAEATKGFDWKKATPKSNGESPFPH